MGCPAGTATPPWRSSSRSTPGSTGLPHSDVLRLHHAGSQATPSAAGTHPDRSLGVSGTELDIRPSCICDHRPGITVQPRRAGVRRDLESVRRANARGACSGWPTTAAEWCWAPAISPNWPSAGAACSRRDQMAYDVNGSVPKTLIQHLIRSIIATGTSAGTPPAPSPRSWPTSSPELVPPGADRRHPSTEDTVEPYELRDFFLYHHTPMRLSAGQITYLARRAW